MRWVAQVAGLEALVAGVPEAAERNRLLDAAYGDIKVMFAETQPEERAFIYHFELVRGRRPG